MVNYSNALKDTAATDRFIDPTFFVSTASFGLGKQNDQTNPAVPDVGLAQDVGHLENFFSATGGAVGTYSTDSGPSPTEFLAVYATGGLGIPHGEVHATDMLSVPSTVQDIFAYQDATGMWVDLVDDTLQPALHAAAQGESCGVVFGDFDVDGSADDVYIGKPGDDLNGDFDVLLINVDGVYVDASASIALAPQARTSEVAAGDVNGDGNLDIVVATRKAPGAGATAASEDYVLFGHGDGNYTAVSLAPGVETDSTSVAVGELGSFAGFGGIDEIVLGRGGSDPYGTEPQLPGEETLTLYTWNPGGPSFVELDQAWIANVTDLAAGTQPHTRQVLLVDLFGPDGGPTNPRLPDGRLDLVVVNGRDALKHDWSTDIVHTPVAPPGNVSFFVNTGSTTPWSLPLFAKAMNGNNEFTIDIPWGKAVAVGEFAHDDGGDTNPEIGLDVFIGRGNRYSGVMPWFMKNNKTKGNQGTPWDLTGGFQTDLVYDILPGTEHGYGIDFADYFDEFGIRRLDGVQTSRGYNYLLRRILNWCGSYAPIHFNLTDPTVDAMTYPDVEHLSNNRGRLKPRAGEDGVFADFNEDGILDLALVIQKADSPGFSQSDGSAPDTIILEGTDKPGCYGSPYFFEEVSLGNMPHDKKVNMQGRAGNTSNLSDRATAADFDNDGDVDLIVRIGDIKTNITFKGGSANVAALGALPASANSYGYRYLENVYDEQGPAIWFREVAPSKMIEPGGGYSDTWNRILASEAVGDFDNNGALDYFSAGGRAHFSARVGYVPPVFDIYGNELTLDNPKPINPNLLNVQFKSQMRDHLFLNGVTDAGAPDPTQVGTLREMGATRLLYPNKDRYADELGIDQTYIKRDAAGMWGVAAGDLDNDGDVDLFGCHHRFGYLMDTPKLLINSLQEAGVARFDDEWDTRVGALDPNVIQSKVDPGSGAIVDDAMFPVLVDFDGDGDLDIVYQVVNDAPRFLRNTGCDANGDGLITAADDSPGEGRVVGEFEDVTAQVLGDWPKPTVDSQDLAVVDIDFDGDFDFVNTAFWDLVTVWRNDSPADGLPKVTEIWPRVGIAPQPLPTAGENDIDLRGVGLSNVDRVELLFLGSGASIVCEGPDLISAAENQVIARIPETYDPDTRGLALVRVRTATGTWSKQYFGYHVLGME